MKRSTYIWSIIALTFLWLLAAHAADREISGLTDTQVVEAYGHLPLSFEANQGQTDKRVRFLARGRGYSLFFTGNEAVLALRKPGGKVARGAHFDPAVVPMRKSIVPGSSLRNTTNTNSALRTSQAMTPNPEPQAPAVLRMRLVGATRQRR